MNTSLKTHDNSEYRYDVFISYSKVNSEWVYDWLVPRLEQSYLEVCIDTTCFEIGAPRAEEIERAIKESRYVLVVLSPAWIRSEWSSFESLLIQHHDPGARFRKLIPVLIEQCDPPDRIKLLNWVDFRTPNQREAGLQRVVEAIKGIEALPELRTHAYPDARQRRWELGWYTIAGASALLSLIVLIGWIYIQEVGPKRMPAGHFNIAVAEILAVDKADRITTNEFASEQAASIAGFLRGETERLRRVVGKQVTVWSPDENVGSVGPKQEEEKAETLNADALIYGTLRELSNDHWEFKPSFYLSDTVVKQADELRGEHALGTPIPYVPGSAASVRDVNITLQKRLRTLVEIFIGLSYYSNRSLDGSGYEKAADVFERVANDTEWGKANDPLSSVGYGQNGIFSVRFWQQHDQTTRSVHNGIGGTIRESGPRSSGHCDRCL